MKKQIITLALTTFFGLGTVGIGFGRDASGSECASAGRAASP